jgi:hypothetical protein
MLDSLLQVALYGDKLEMKYKPQIRAKYKLFQQ